MDHARPLRSVLAELAGERGVSGLSPDEVLAAGGHADLPEGLVAEAVVNYADTAPVEVAEHLAPYVRDNSAVPQSGEPAAEAPDWYGLLITAPPVAGFAGDSDVLDADVSALASAAGVDDATPVTSDSDEVDVDLDFGQGDRGPIDDPTSGIDRPTVEHLAVGSAEPGASPWSADTDPSSHGLEADPAIDLGPLPGDDAGDGSDDGLDTLDD